MYLQNCFQFINTFYVDVREICLCVLEYSVKQSMRVHMCSLKIDNTNSLSLMLHAFERRWLNVSAVAHFKYFIQQKFVELLVRFLADLLTCWLMRNTPILITSQLVLASLQHLMKKTCSVRPQLVDCFYQFLLACKF